jgi:hypothetical protein
MNKDVPLKASKLMLKEDRPDRLNYFNFKKNRAENAFCHSATGSKLLTSPGVADTYAFLMRTWCTLLESYQQRVYNNTLATVKSHIQHEENPTPAVVISVDAEHVDNGSLLDYLTSEVALE